MPPHEARRAFGGGLSDLGRITDSLPLACPAREKRTHTVIPSSFIEAAICSWIGFGYIALATYLVVRALNSVN